MSANLESLACTAVPVQREDFNPAAILPNGCTVEHVSRAMSEFLDFLTFVNVQLHQRELSRLEMLLMPASFSSLVSEFMCWAIPR